MASRALVMSGGGPVGIAWHAGMTASLTEAGVDLADADLIVGTSAGSVVGAYLRLGRNPLGRLRDVEPEGDDGLIDPGTLPERMQGLIGVMFASADATAEERLKAIGAFALAADTISEEAFIDRVAGVDEWPERYLCTGVDAATGTFSTWGADSGVDVRRAIAASCAVPGFFPPITIDGRRYIDGGMRSMTNADVAAGHERVLILTVFDPPDIPEPRVQRLRKVRDDEVAAIEAAGGSALVVPPDDEAKAVTGTSLMDPTKIAEAAEAGLAQGKREAERIAAFWA